MTDDNQLDENQLIAQRREKLAKLRENGVAFPNDFRRNVTAGELHAEYDDTDKEALETDQRRVCVAGRMMAKRIMGKASFTHIQDMSGRIQLYVQRDALPEGVYKEFKGFSFEPDSLKSLYTGLACSTPLLLYGKNRTSLPLMS